MCRNGEKICYLKQTGSFFARGVSADSAEAQALADKLQAHIAENYIHFYNTHRYQKRLNCMTPCEYYLSTAA